jgi:hypothetical protein
LQNLVTHAPGVSLAVRTVIVMIHNHGSMIGRNHYKCHWSFDIGHENHLVICSPGALSDAPVAVELGIIRAMKSIPTKTSQQK